VIQRAALSELRDDFTQALTDEDVGRRGLSKKLFPHVITFNQNDIGAPTHVPF